MLTLVTILTLSLTAVSLAAGPDGMWGRRQGGGPAHGSGGGGGPIHDILDGQPFTISGEVVSLAFYGGGMVIAAETENVTGYGLGSPAYWESQGVTPPSVGETVSVTGYTVDFNGVSRNIAASVTVGDGTIQLRDPETGLPLWRGGNF